MLLYELSITTTHQLSQWSRVLRIVNIKTLLYLHFNRSYITLRSSLSYISLCCVHAHNSFKEKDTITISILFLFLLVGRFNPWLACSIYINFMLLPRFVNEMKFLTF